MLLQDQPPPPRTWITHSRTQQIHGRAQPICQLQVGRRKNQGVYGSGQKSWPSVYVKINAMLQGLAKTREEREGSMSQETKRMVF